MSLKNDASLYLKFEDLVFISALAGRFDAQSRLIAKSLDKGRYIHNAFAFFDGISCSSTFFKYCVEVWFSSPDPDLMHEIMLTREGIIAIATESIFLVTFSFLASRFEKEKKNVLKKFIAAAWLYCRDVLKALKNALKGWRSTVQMLSFLSGADLRYMIIPVGLLLGVVAAVNRIWLRSMFEERKSMMNATGQILIGIKKLKELKKEQRDIYLRRIKGQSQSSKTRVGAFFSVILGGFIDGLYLYIGVLSLAVLPPPVLAVLFALSVFYTLSCVVMRVYEEYDFQLKLLIMHTKCHLALAIKELETVYPYLLQLKNKTDKILEDIKELNRMERDLCLLINKFDALRKQLHQQTANTYLMAALFGLKNGLYAYGALNSALFVIALILFLSSTSFPPALLATTVIFGVVLIIGFVAHGLIANYFQQKNQSKKDGRAAGQLMNLKKSIEIQKEKANIPDEEVFKNTINASLLRDPNPQYIFQEWFEIVRSFFSGAGKGQRFIDFAGNSFQELNEQGHYRDTPIMLVFGAFSALLFGVVLGLRALAKGLGRNPLGSESVVTVQKKVQTVEKDVVTIQSREDANKEQTKKPEKLSQNTTPRVDSPVFMSPGHRFFPKPQSSLKSKIPLVNVSNTMVSVF